MTIIEQAEQHSAKRAATLSISGALLIVSGLVDVLGSGGGLDRLFGGWFWVAWIAVLLVVLWTGGFLTTSKEIRALMNDEVALHNRARAIALGFWIAVAALLILYAVSLYEPVLEREAIRLVVDISLASVLLRYGWLERS